MIWTLTFLASKQSSVKLRAWICTTSVTLCVLILFIFKYFGMFSYQSQSILQWFGVEYTLPIVDVVLPLGLSFYTFQAIAYVVSIAREEREAANFFDFVNYLSFAPTIIAGPICRPNQLLDFFNKRKVVTTTDLDNIILLLVSFFIKKVWLSSWIGNAYVDPVFADASSRNSFELVLALIAYSLQIFFDFSGYTDLARAIAAMLGFDLPKNFNLPYLAKSLSEFWARWHISLSTWIRDYIYFPLGGSRKGPNTTIVNLITAMALSGLWHGASLNFLIWGIYHGLLLSIEKVSKARGLQFKSVGFTFVAVSFGWIFFRCETLAASSQYIQAFTNWNYPLDLSLNHFSIFLIVMLAFAVWFSADKILPVLVELLNRTPFIVKAVLTPVFISLILSFSPDGMPSFIYAQF